MSTGGEREAFRSYLARFAHSTAHPLSHGRTGAGSVLPSAMYNGLQVAIPGSVLTEAAQSEAEWMKLLAGFGFPVTVATAVYEVFGPTGIGLSTFDDFRCFFKKDADFLALIILKATLPGPVDIPQPGKWAARMTQVWESLVGAHTDFQAIETGGKEAQDLDKLLDQTPLNDLHICFLGALPHEVRQRTRTRGFPCVEKEAGTRFIPPHRGKRVEVQEPHLR